jgi:hypothetical protein
VPVLAEEGAPGRMKPPRPYRPGRSRIARQIDRRARLLTLRRDGAGALAEALESFGRALDQGPVDAGLAGGDDDGETTEHWWEK